MNRQHRAGATRQRIELGESGLHDTEAERFGRLVRPVLMH